MKSLYSNAKVNHIFNLITAKPKSDAIVKPLIIKKKNTLAVNLPAPEIQINSNNLII